MIEIDVHNKDTIKTALRVIGKGGVIIYPTDTLYGFGVDAANDNAIEKLNSIKQLGISTFIKTKDGFKVTSPEGYVVADSSQRAVKLVDRLEFSFNNFTAIKNWDK